MTQGGGAWGYMTVHTCWRQSCSSTVTYMVMLLVVTTMESCRLWLVPLCQAPITIGYVPVNQLTGPQDQAGQLSVACVLM